ncbi:DNA-binding transcriptional MerR regulator [Sporosarcina luteola]|nr:DNA-binding transcriptional MerR regulator [Sporosarcina luteola]
MYTIGNFSKICEVPVKTIRYYSDLGLLAPSYIDPKTNYRYYDYDKIKELKTILILKDCHFSLTEIDSILEEYNKKDLAVKLQRKAETLKKQQEDINRKIIGIRQIQKLLQNDEVLIPEPIYSNCYLEERDALQVFSIRKTINMIEMDTLVAELFERIYAYQLLVNGALAAIFHDRDTKEKAADVELLLPVKAAEKETYLKTIPGGIYACIDIRGPYSDLHIGYQQLKSWLENQSIDIEGKYMEQYTQGLVPSKVSDPVNIKPAADIHPSDFLTKIFVKTTKPI